MRFSPIPRIGILGVGQRGLQHLDVLWRLQADGAVRVAALCDAWEDNLAEEKIRRYVAGYDGRAVATYTAFDRMMEDARLDAVYFCLPPGVHKGEVVAAASAGMHVFVEKPMSLYYDEAAEMEEAIRRAGVVSGVGFQLRYDSWNEAVRAYLADRRIVLMSSVSHGALEAHSTKHTHTEELGGPANRVWTANFEWSGSAVVEAGIHPLDRMRYWGGDVSWVQASYVPRDPEDVVHDGNNPCACVVTFGFASGALGTLHITKLRRVYHSDGYEIILWDHGHLKFESEGPVAYYYDGPYPPPAPPNTEALRHPIPAPPRADATTALSKAFLYAITTGDTSWIRSSFPDSMNSLAAVLAANASHALGGERINLAQFAAADRYAQFRKRMEES